MTKEQQLNLLILCAMTGSDFEKYAERGEDYRNRLSNAVIKHLALGDEWRCEAEFRGEFGGSSPVHLRLTHAQANDLVVNVCSSNEDVDQWGAFIPCSENRIAWVYTSELFEPDSVRDVLQHLHECVIAGASSADEVAMMLRQQGAAV
ncbi:conjugation system SOS inhibitor PsiB family protein [Pectobacterium carotovorum]|uniref:conjugation system SOS inhibitor PsiB family protein n=1 Tax=Pectobacterium carotovorum TaxID=554 RepID=UPI0032EED6A4